MQCLICGNETKKPETGRPARYCSVACRRAREFEVRRLNKRLGQLESRRDDESELVDAPTTYCDMYGRAAAERLAAVEKLIARAQSRLKALLGADD